MKLILFLLLNYILTCISINNPEDFINPLSGTFTDGQSYSTGNTLPLIGRPWGFNHWAPQTTQQNHRSSSWWFGGNDHTLHWLRCTHQPSPWIGDWGWFLFMPQVGGFSDNPNFWWQPRGSIIKPHLFDATLAPHGLRVELVPTDHAAILRVTFPSNTDSLEKRVCFREGNWDTKKESFQQEYIIGSANQVNMDRLHFENFHLFITTKTDKSATIERHGSSICYHYGSKERVVLVSIGTSLISQAQSKYNLESEVGNRPFEEIQEETQLIWNKLLNRVNIVDPGEITSDVSKNLMIFYTGLYRALMFPRRLDEKDLKTGQIVHFSPYDSGGKVYPGSLVTDNGFWDTFRTVYPLLGLAYRSELGFIIEGWLNAYKEGGWLPSWASPGYRNCMVGTYADVVVADAIIKDIKGFDLEVARSALKKDAFNEPPGYAGSAIGKEGLREYSQNGFMAASGNTESVSRSLDFGFADFATARAYDYLETNQEYLLQNRNHLDELREDSKKLDSRWNRAVESCFSQTHGLMAPKSRERSVVPSFDPVEWGNGFVEGNSWHHSFPPYALKKLIELYGSEKKLLAKLHELMSVTSDFRVGSYHQEIHEMTEMRTLAMGQYGHNNQPSHHILYLFALLGEKEYTEQYVREVINRGYGVDFYAGDEDNGEQGAWFVLSALGLFSTTPGTPDYVLNTPLFKHVVIDRSNNYNLVTQNYAKLNNDPVGNDFHIIAMNADSLNIHTTKVLLNGNEITSPTVSDHDIQSSGILQFFIETAHPEDVQTPLKDVEINLEQARKLLSNQANQANQALESQKEEYKKEIEKQKRLIASLTNELAVHLQEHYAVPEYMKIIQTKGITDLITEPQPSTPRSSNALILEKEGEEDKPCRSTLTQLELGLGFIAANLFIIAIMMGIQISRNSNNGENERGSNGNMSFVKIITCCCNPVMISQFCASVFGTNTVYSLMGRPNKRDTYTV